MSHMSNKDVDDHNAKVVEVEGYVCPICGKEFWKGFYGFCSEECASEQHPWKCEQCGRYYTTGYSNSFCSKSCMIEWSNSDKAQEMLFDWLGIKPKEMDKHIKANNLRVGKTLPLRR